ncbi:MAG: O-methyltransferase [Lachnospiraceae bacterium]|nr:O-methyltransferase [Lachnospiraceae bacterium]MEE3460991.1 O-methyltransferase [Lachnospiraceae bacterium]
MDNIDINRLDHFNDYLTWSLPEDLKKLYIDAYEHNVPVIRKPAQTFIKTILLTLRPEEILEIGTAVGFSALLMHDFMKEHGFPCNITTVEKVESKISEAEKNFKDFGADDINLMKMDALDALKELKGGFDLIFIDAAKAQYVNYLPYVLRLIKDHGVILTDNIYHDGDVLGPRSAVRRRDRTIYDRMREYLHILTHTDGIQTTLLTEGDGMSFSVVDKEMLSLENIAKF